jgi:hypothetical protein
MRVLLGREVREERSRLERPAAVERAAGL